MKLIWRLVAAVLCCFVIIKLMLVVEFISHTSEINQDRLKQQLLRPLSGSDDWNNSVSSSVIQNDHQPYKEVLLLKNLNASHSGVVKKANELVIPTNVRDYPMGIAIGTLIRVFKENGASGK